MAEPRFSYGDYIHWPENERWELIDGTAVAMTPAPSRRHQKLLMEIAARIHSALQGRPCEVYPAPFDVRLPDADEPDEEVRSVVQPDLSIVCDRAKLDDRGCRGAPDFIIEIASPSTASHDEVRKRALYEKHGVREYWIVDPERKTAMIRVLGADGLYGEAVVPELRAGRGVLVSAVPGVEIDLAAAFRTLEA